LFAPNFLLYNYYSKSGISGQPFGQDYKVLFLRNRYQVLFEYTPAFSPGPFLAGFLMAHFLNGLSIFPV